MTVGIVGLGLIGGSVGLALRDPSRRLVGYDPSPSACEMALERQCVDACCALEDVAQADIVFVAAPPAHLIEVLEKLMLVKGTETIVTDCASVKGEVVDWAERTKEPNFVPGHPMAGHERSGAQFSSAWMFKGARWVLTPASKTSKAAVQSVEQLVKTMGATPIRVSGALHDRHVAILSHLPHAIAGVLVQMGEQLERTDVSAGSWRDVTRVGGVDPDLWSQIFIGNRVEISRALAEMEAKLGELRGALESGDEAAVRVFFEHARAAKEKQTVKEPAAPRRAAGLKNKGRAARKP